MQRLRGYVAAWVVAAALSSGLVVALDLSAPDAVGGAWAAGLFLVLTALADRIDLRLHHGSAEEGLTLAEAAIAANLLLFPATTALGITFGGVAVAQLLQRRAGVKSVFNVAQLTAATAVALLVFHALRGSGPALALQGLVAVAVAMAAHGLVNSVSVSGIISILERRPFAAVAREGGSLQALIVLGNTAVGILAAVLWVDRPALVLLLAVPAATLHLAYRGVVRSAELLAEVGAERDRLDRIVVGASDGIVLLDRSGVIEVWSPAMERLTGIPQTEAVGGHASRYLSGTDLRGAAVDPTAPLRAADPDEPLSDAELTLTHREGGSPRTVLARHTLLFDERRRVAGDVILVHDVTREREIGRMKDDFVSRVSHELRTPLTPIKGFAQSLLRRSDQMDADVRRRALEQIVDRTEHMTRLIEDLLLVGRISSGKATIADQINLEPFDVGDQIERTVDAFRVGHPDRLFNVSVEPGLDAVVGDPTRVEQVASNLLTNACRYSQRGLPVHVAVRSGGPDRVEISVTDEGRGIPPEHLERIFDRFHRVEDPMIMETGGLGLGLYIAREFAVGMGGTLDVVSRLGEGSTFTLSLPTAPLTERGSLPTEATSA